MPRLPRRAGWWWSLKTRTGCFGQAIITEVVGRARFNRFLSPPLLVAREDGHIPFNPVLEYAVLPDAARVHAALAEVMQ
jgi:2-oxoisovalerate dehydrogenase E1 component